MSVSVFVCWSVLSVCVSSLVCFSVGIFVCGYVCLLLLLLCWSVGVDMFTFCCDIISIRLLSRLALPICLNYLYMINVVQLSHRDDSVPTTVFTKVCDIL